MKFHSQNIHWKSHQIVIWCSIISPLVGTIQHIMILNTLPHHLLQMQKANWQEQCKSVVSQRGDGSLDGGGLQPLNCHCNTHHRILSRRCSNSTNLLESLLRHQTLESYRRFVARKINYFERPFEQERAFCYLY